jgi:hypothetical protein
VRVCDRKGHRIGSWEARCSSAMTAAGGLYSAASKLRVLLVATDSSSSILASRDHRAARSQVTDCNTAKETH